MDQLAFGDRGSGSTGIGRVGAPDSTGPDALAVAKDRHAVGEREDLLEPVRDVDDPHTIGPETPHHAEEALLLLSGERSGRFVHNDDPGSGPESASDLHELLFRHRERSDLRIRIDLRSDASQQFLRGFPPDAPSDPAEQPEIFEPDPDVLRDREVREQRRLLIDAGDPEAMGFSGREG